MTDIAFKRSAVSAAKCECAGDSDGSDRIQSVSILNDPAFE